MDCVNDVVATNLMLLLITTTSVSCFMALPASGGWCGQVFCNASKGNQCMTHNFDVSLRKMKTESCQ